MNMVRTRRYTYTYIPYLVTICRCGLCVCVCVCVCVCRGPSLCIHIPSLFSAKKSNRMLVVEIF